jgi:hypothetical protein
MRVSRPDCCEADVGFKWVSDITKEEMTRWYPFRTGELCKCGSKHPKDCECVVSVDRVKEPRLMAMMDANSEYFGISQKFTDDAIPLTGLYKCVTSCHLLLMVEKANQEIITARNLL